MNNSSNSLASPTEASKNVKSQYYQATKSRFMNKDNSSKTLRNLSPASAGFSSSSLLSPKTDDKPTGSSFRFSNNQPKSTKAAESSFTKGTTQSPTTVPGKKANPNLSLNFSSFKSPRNVGDAKSVTFTTRETLEKKLSNENQGNTSSSGTRCATEPANKEESSVLSPSTASTAEKVDMTKKKLGRIEKSLMNISTRGMKSVTIEDKIKSPASARRQLTSNERRAAEKVSSLALSKDLSKRETKEPPQLRLPSSKKNGDIKNPKTIDSIYNFDSRKHSKSCSELYAHQFHANEVVPEGREGVKLKIEPQLRDATPRDVLGEMKKWTVQFGSKNPAFRSRIEELDFEREQDISLIKSLQDELSIMHGKLKSPRGNVTFTDTQLEVSFRGTEESKSLNIDKENNSSDDIKQKEIDMLRLQNANLKLTIEFLTNENKLLKDAQEQVSQFKEMAAKYKELAEAKIKECYVLAEEVISLRKNLFSSTSTQKPLYSELLSQNLNLDSWAFKIDQSPSFALPKMNAEKFSEKVLEIGSIQNIEQTEKEPGATPSTKLPSPQTIDVKMINKKPHDIMRSASMRQKKELQ